MAIPKDECQHYEHYVSSENRYICPITKHTLFEFIAGWDFQPVPKREQVIRDFYDEDPDYIQLYGATDWNDLPATVREALHDECE